MEPFLFRSYFYCLKGQANDVIELEIEMKRLNRVDPGCLEWHLDCGHLTAWLKYIGEKNLAERLVKAGDLEEAIKIVSRTASRRREASTNKGRTIAKRPPASAKE